MVTQLFLMELIQFNNLEGLGEKSGGQREFVEYLSRAATAVGIAAIF